MEPSFLLSPEKKAFKEYLNSICSALGGFEKTTEEVEPRIKASPAYRNGFVYVPGDECLECIKDLRKLMRQEERSLDKPTRLQLAEWNTFSEDLLPILALHTDFLTDTLGRSCFELIAYMMTPIVNRPFSNNVSKEIKEEEEMVEDVKDSTNYGDEEPNEYAFESGDDNSDYQDEDSVFSDEDGPKKLVSFEVAIKEHRFHQLRYKQTLLSNKWFFFHLVEQTSILLSNPAWSESDERFLFTMLTLVRSLLTLENPLETNIQSSHDLLLERLQECHCLDLILVLVASVKDYKFQPYTWLFLDIIFCIFRFVDFDNLCLSVQADGKIDENVSSHNQNGLKQQVKSDQACTLSEIISKSTRHSKFGGTNTLHLNKGKKSNFFSTNKLSKKMELSGPGLANLKVTSPEALLELLQLRRGDSHNKRVTKKVDVDTKRSVLHGPTRRLLLEFAFQFACGASVSLFEATQKKSLKSTNDDRGREISVLTLTLKLCHHYITFAKDWTIVRAVLPLLSSSALPHYIMSTISDFKDSKCFKALSVALNCLLTWLKLIIALHKLPDTFVSINTNPEDPEETRTILQQLQQVGHHHLHNFVHDYALLRPLHDLYSSPYYHPSNLSSLIPTTFYLNQAVKLAILFRKGDLFARTRKQKRTKRSKKPESSNKRKKHPKAVLDNPSTKHKENPDISPITLETPNSPKESSENPLASLETRNEPSDQSPAPLELSKSPNVTSSKTDDPLAGLFSDDDDVSSNHEKNIVENIEKNAEKLDSDNDFLASEEETNVQTDNDSDTEDEATREFNERSLDFKKFLQTYTSEGVINGHMIYLERVLAQAGSPGMMLNQPDLHSQLNDPLQMIVTMLHQLVVQLDCTRLLYRASYLHSLYNAKNQCKAISAAFLVPSSSGNLVIKLPSSLRWISELEKLVDFSFTKILEMLKADPWFLQSLLPKSANKKLKGALLKPVTPPPIESPDPPTNNVNLSSNNLATSFNTISTPKSTETHSASSPSKVASGDLSPSQKHVTNGCTPTKNNFVDDFSDEFLDDLFA